MCSVQTACIKIYFAAHEGKRDDEDGRQMAELRVDKPVARDLTINRGAMPADSDCDLIDRHLCLKDRATF